MFVGREQFVGRTTSGRSVRTRRVVRRRYGQRVRRQRTGGVRARRRRHHQLPTRRTRSVRIMYRVVGFLLMPAVYQVTGFGRGDGRHSGRHRRSVV